MHHAAIDQAPGQTNEDSAATAASGKSVGRRNVRRGRQCGAQQTFFGRNAFKIDKLLSEEVRQEYESLLRQPGTTQAVARQWLHERGYSIGVGAVARHQTRFGDLLRNARDAAHLARAFADVARAHGAASANDAAAAFAEQQMMQSLFQVLAASQEQDEFDAKRWQDIHKAIGAAIANRAHVETLRADVAAQLKAAADTAEEGEKAGLSGRAIAAKIRALLGVPQAADQEDECDPAIMANADSTVQTPAVFEH